MDPPPAVVLDCSVAMAWCFADEYSDYAQQVLKSLGMTTPFVPSLWRYEVANVLVVAERRGRIAAADSDRFLELLTCLRIIVDDGGAAAWKATLTLARRTGLAAYDAAYLELALRGGLPVATLDERMRKAAIEHGVAVFSIAPAT
jgi:predicted nucleic acid-binding protein